MREWQQALRDRLQGLRIRPEREAEIVDELAQHLEVAEDVVQLAAQTVQLVVGETESGQIGNGLNFLSP